MIGIIIGIASVITIMSLGNGFKKSTTEQFNNAGAGKNQASMIGGVQERFASYNDQDYYHEAIEYIRPRKFLLHNLSYEEDHR